MNTIRLNKHNPECLIFFNPMASDTCFWKNNLPDHLATKYEIIFIDYPGYNSPLVSLPSFQDMANYIHDQILSTLNKPFYLIGYSYGGLLVQFLLKNNYSQHKGTVLVGCSYKLTPKDKETTSILGKIIETDVYLFCRVLTLFSHNPEEINSNPLIGLQKFSNLKLTVNNSNPIIQQINHIKKMKEIKHDTRLEKTLIVYGENDKMIDTSTLEAFRENFKNLKIVQLKNEYHMINTELIYLEITNFLNT